MSISENIKEARKSAGLTQKGLAERSGVAVVSIQQYERGVRQPRLEQLEAIAKALGVPIADLLIGPPPLEGDDDISLQDSTISASDMNLLREIGGLPEADKQLVLAMVKRLRDTGEESAAVQTSEGTYYLYHYPERSQELAQATPAPQEGTDTTPTADAPETPTEGQ